MIANRLRTIMPTMVGLVCVLLFSGGCTSDTELADASVRKDVTVRAVEHYGLTLDQAASPEQVAFVVLRAIREDYLAAGDAEREAALDVQFDVCAASLLARMRSRSTSADAFIHKVVIRWTPTLAQYVRGFDTDWGQAKSRLVFRPQTGSKLGGVEVEVCFVLLAVDDPSGVAGAGAVVSVGMAKDGGYWRVLRVSFDPAKRAIRQARPTARKTVNSPTG